jgi:predicted glycosyltransferase
VSERSLRVLFDVNHPAQVHLFKHAIAELDAAGHETLVAARDKEVTLALLEAYDIDHRSLSSAGSGLGSLLRELLVREAKLYALARSFDPDVVVSRLSPPAVHVSRLVGCRNVVLNDTVIPSRVLRVLYRGSTLPFVDAICAPPGFDLPFVRGRRYDVGFQELAYLHPDRFEPNRDRLESHGVDPDERYFVLRFAGWEAFHDVGRAGWSAAGKRDLVEYLAARGTVYVSSEGPMPPAFAEYELAIPPAAMHDLLWFADLYVGDSQTMPTEAALLGTPAVRVNPNVGDHDISNFTALERRGLLASTSDEDRALDRVREYVSETADGTDWQRQRHALIAAHRDVTAFTLALIRGDDPTDDGAITRRAGARASDRT